MKLLKPSIDTYETLPDTIELVGFGINKSAYLNEIMLTTAHPTMIKLLGSSFDWGLMNKGSGLLSFAVLNTFMAPGEARYLFTTFQNHFLQHVKEIVNPKSTSRIPTSSFNFKLVIQLKKWYECLLNNDVATARKAFELLATEEEVILKDAAVNEIQAELARAQKVEFTKNDRGVITSGVITEFVNEEDLAKQREDLAKGTE